LSGGGGEGEKGSLMWKIEARRGGLGRGGRYGSLEKEKPVPTTFWIYTGKGRSYPSSEVSDPQSLARKRGRSFRRVGEKEEEVRSIFLLRERRKCSEEVWARRERG